MHQPWRTLASIINKFLSGKTFSNDRLRQSRLAKIWGMFHKKNVDFAELIWEDFSYQIDNRQLKKGICEIMPYPRFTKSSSTISSLFTNPFPKYRPLVSIQSRMMVSLQGIHWLLHRLVPPKKTRDKDVAFKLGKSINKTNAKIADEISRVYETHARVTIRDTPRVSKKKLVDQSQKLKGIQTLNAKEQLAANMMQALKASKKSNRSRSHTGGSSEGTSIIPGVPDESTFIIANSNKGTEDKSDSSTESDELKGIEKEKIEEKEIEWVSTNEKDEQLDDHNE
ncbi:hypothetical protein Tco_0052491 [Tanacetum coccineum]